jgi:hypothetical protein
MTADLMLTGVLTEAPFAFAKVNLQVPNAIAVTACVTSELLAIVVPQTKTKLFGRLRVDLTQSSERQARQRSSSFCFGKPAYRR